MLDVSWTASYEISLICLSMSIQVFSRLDHEFFLIFYMMILTMISSDWHSLSNSCRHWANVAMIADVKSQIIVSRRHFFAYMIFLPLQKFKTIKIKLEKNPYTQTNTWFLNISRNFKDMRKCNCLYQSLLFAMFLFQ